ncbi:MAG: Fe-only nitrogenase accessory AnfO family protein [Bacillota bacterium]
MYDKIAVLLDENNQLTSLELSQKTLLYHETINSWEPLREINWQLAAESDIAKIRNNIQILIEQLGDCRIMVSRKLSGVPYHIFNKMEFHIFEADGVASQKLFRDIIQEIKGVSEKVRPLDSIAQVPVSPQNDGTYYLNLIELQRAFPEVTSKQALKQFLEETPFNKLELICSHMPPWIETVAAVKNFDWKIEKLDELSCKAVISVKDRSES